MLTIPRHPRPWPPDAGSRNLLSRFGCCPCGHGILCLAGFAPRQRPRRCATGAVFL